MSLKTFEHLFERVLDAKDASNINNMPMKLLELEADALKLELELMKFQTLGEMPRTPVIRLDQFETGNKHYIHYRREAAEWYQVNHRKKWTSKNISRAAFLKAKKKNQTLNAPYQPASDACVVLNTQVPDSMAFETQSAIELLIVLIGECQIGSVFFSYFIITLRLKISIPEITDFIYNKILWVTCNGE